MIIEKKLSENDLGMTGSHQAGILIPKDKELLSFFPRLDSKQYNPRIAITFEDSSKKKWIFNFIYYNNKFYGGTRNEYRLTGMTKYLKETLLEPGDYVVFCLEENKYSISHRKNNQAKVTNMGDVIMIEINDWTLIGERGGY